MNAPTIANVLGVKPDTVRQWGTRGLTEELADQLACAFGYHPSEVWWTWYVLDDLRFDRELRRDRIEQRFRKLAA